VAARIKRSAPIVMAGLIGGVFFFWIAGLRVVLPTEIGWVMQLDWQHHFIGWHFFRREDWHWPPGLIRRYFAPIGTSIGGTDSIPLVAIALKPASPFLPAAFQYLGLWLLLCFVLQGIFGAMLGRLWTRNPWLQVGAGSICVLTPTLLGRVGHAALASHWLVLWALWTYLRESVRPASWISHGMLGLLAGLIHPYLAVMVLCILASLVVRRLLERHDLSFIRVAGAIGPFAASVTGVLIGWWSSGLLSTLGTSDLVGAGLGHYSMNLLGPVAPAGWSTLLPELPLASELQRFEGFQYLGAGNLALVLVALACAASGPRLPWREVAPLLFVALLLALYAISPRVTIGDDVVLDLLTPSLERFAVFRSTGRFFWPVGYALIAFAVWATVSRLSPRAAIVILTVVIALQIADLHGHYQTLRATARSEQFHSWPQPLQSTIWHRMLPHYKRLLLYPPEQCGPAPMAFLHAAFLAGTYGLSINTGHLARVDRVASATYCQQIADDLNSGTVADDAIYLLHPAGVSRFRRSAQRPVVCAELDAIPTCVTAASYEKWQALAVFE
jgi:Family of unknown function (DUF6311)